MNKNDAKAIVKTKLPEKRYKHSKRVAKTALQMAEIFEADKNKCYLAGILHDYCKYDDLGSMYQIVTRFKLNPRLLEFKSEVLHGPVAAVIAREQFGIDDEEIFQAIKSHTTGRAHMALVEKIIFVADYIEPKREQPGVDKIRKIIFEQKKLDLAVYEITKSNLKQLISKNRSIYQDTIECYNYYNMVKE